MLEIRHILYLINLPESDLSFENKKRRSFRVMEKSGDLAYTLDIHSISTAKINIILEKQLKLIELVIRQRTVYQYQL